MPHPMIQPEAMMNTHGAVFTLVIPYFDADDMKALAPHASGNTHYLKSTATKAHRELACLISRAHMPSEPWTRCRLNLRYYKPSDRVLDHLNMAGRVKAIIDGVVDAGLIPDDNDQYLEAGPQLSDIDKDNPRIELVFERLRGSWNNGAKQKRKVTK